MNFTRGRPRRRNVALAGPGLAAVLALVAGLSPARAADQVVSVKGRDGDAVQAAWRSALAKAKQSPGDRIIVQLPDRISAPDAIRLSGGGAPGAPITLRGAKAGTVVTGARWAPSRPASDNPRAAQLPFPKEMRARIRWVELGRLLSPAEQARVHYVYSQTPTVHEGRAYTYHGQPLAFSGGARLTPTRWPQDKDIEHPQPIEDSQRPYVLYADAYNDQAVDGVRLEAELAERLTREPAFAVVGFLSRNWLYETFEPVRLDKDAVYIRRPKYAVMPQNGHFWLENLASALSAPGQFFFDKRNWDLYYIPAPGDRSNGLDLPVAEHVLIADGARHVRIENVAFKQATKSAVLMTNAEDVVISGAFIGQSKIGAEIVGGRDNRIEKSVIDDIGLLGIDIDGGDRKTLTPANNGVFESRITHYGKDWGPYNPGVRLRGVGNKIVDNEIAFGEHAILYFHNDHEISGNIIHDIVEKTGDQGAIYAASDYAARGTVVRNNYLYNIRAKTQRHHFSGGVDKVMGLYIDDLLSGQTLDGNIIINSFLPIQVSGGRQNKVTNNLIANFDRPAAIDFDRRGMVWPSESNAITWSLEGLFAVDYQHPPYSDRYPGLASVLTDRPFAPIDNEFSGNVVMGRGKTLLNASGGSDRYVTPRNNTLIDQDPAGLDLDGVWRGVVATGADSPALRQAYARVKSTQSKMLRLTVPH